MMPEAGELDVVLEFNRLIETAGQTYTRLVAARRGDHLPNSTIKLLWQIIMMVTALRDAADFTRTKDNVKRIKALKRISVVLGEKAIPLLEESISDPTLSLQAREDARQEKAEVQRRHTKEDIRQVVAETITELTGHRVTGLDKYDGHACARFDGANRFAEGEIAGTATLLVWLQKESPTRVSGTRCERIEIVEGDDVDPVTFEVNIDSNTLALDSPRQLIRTPLHGRSVDLHFLCSFREPGQHSAWVQINQKNRLIQVVHVVLDETQSGTSSG